MPEPHVATAKRMLEQTGQHPVVSLYFDLDPAEFATAPARATQADSLLGQAREARRSDQWPDHDDKVALDEDLDFLGSYLRSDELPVQGAAALAIFRSARDGLFEVVSMTRPGRSDVVIDHIPHVEPLVAGHDFGRCCVILVNRPRRSCPRRESVRCCASECATGRQA